MKLVVLILLTLIYTPAIGSTIVVNRATSTETSELVEMFKNMNITGLRSYCKKFAEADNAIPALATNNQFPLAQNQTPASEFVGPFISLRLKGREIGILPIAHSKIWNILTLDSDKILTEAERNDIVDLWLYTKTWLKISCPV